MARTRIQALRQHAQDEAADPSKYTQQACADAVGVDLRTWQAWEAGERQPRRYYRRRIAKVLGTSVDDLGITEG